MNINQLMKQAQQMQKSLAEAQSKLAVTETEGSAGYGMVHVVIDGKGAIKTLTIDPKLMNPDDADMVADLVVVAFNEAKAKLDEIASTSMSGLVPPGLKLPF